MIPEIELLNEEFEIEEMPTKTHKYDFVKENHIRSYTDNIEAMKQAVFLILNTERYAHVIYSWDYGIELADLFGRAISYVYPVAKQRIKEALEWDDRIENVDSFSYEIKKKRGTVYLFYSSYGFWLV